MKILHVIPSMGAVHGGPPQAVLAICRAQAELGANITLVTTDDNGANRLDVPLEQPIEQDGYRTIYFRRTLRAYTFSRPLTRWLIDHIADYDFVHAHAVFRYPPLLAAFLASIRRVPYTVTPHGLLLSWGVEARNTRMKRISYLLIEKRLLNNSAFIHVTSARESQELQNLGVQVPIQVVYFGLGARSAEQIRVERIRQIYQDVNGRIILLFIGRFHPIKGFDVLLPAFARATQTNDDLVLALAGRGAPEYEKWMRDEIARLGISDRVMWLGFLDEEAKWHALVGSDIVVLPSHSESFGMTAIEGLAAGKPVIVSDRVAIHDVIDQAGAGAVVPCQVELLAEAIDRLAKDDNLRREMGSQGVNVVREKFNKLNTASTLLASYEKHICHV